MVSPGTPKPAISGKSYVFKTIPSDAHQGVFGAELEARIRFTKMPSLYVEESYATGFRNALETEFPKQRGKVVYAETFEKKTR